MKTLKTLVALTCAATFTATADVRINGFANLIAGITSSDDTLYGYDDKISFSEESLFAIQISGDVNDKVTATGQLVARGSDDYDPDFEWAYLTYSATDTISVSAGRLRLPLFKFSASKDVGYSYHWVNAPRSVYDVPFNNLDGFRLDYNNYAGDWEYNLQAAMGTISSDVETSLGDIAKVEGDNVIMFSAEATYDWFKIRGVVGSGKITVTSDAINAPLNGLRAAGLTSLADDLALEDDSASFVGFGVDVDKFDWFASAEYTVITTDDSYNPEDKAFYVTAGLRIDKWTPSITYENKDGTEDPKFLDKVAALPAAVQPTAAAVTVGLQQAFQEEFDLITLGLRYDYDTNIALKADVSKFSDDVNDANDTTLVRFAVNYVF